MKIKINYDLIKKISETEKGFILNKTTKYVLGLTTCALLFDRCLLPNLNTNDTFLSDLSFYLIYYTVIGIPINYAHYKTSQSLSIQELKSLVILLQNINVNTNYELLLKSYKYHTEYKLEFDESKAPYIIQEKYINIPIYDNGNEKEVSLVQEHIIGSKSYTLSYGSPKKVLKLATNPI